MANKKNDAKFVSELLDVAKDPEKFHTLLKKVVDGDKNAIEQLRFYLEITDKMQQENPDDANDNSPMLDNEDDDASENYEEDGLFYIGSETLKHDDVKELHLRIKLNNTDLKIWRELKVPSNISLPTLAEILLDVMGWTHEHLYQFVVGDDVFKTSYAYNDSKSMIGFGRGRFREYDMTKYTLSDLNFEKGKRIRFEYDFGDSWQHDLWIKGVREYNNGEKPTIICVKGQGACPPENCGGVWGYSDLLELTKKKKLTADEKEELEGYDMLEDFDPDYFDIDFANVLLKKWNGQL